MKRNIRISAICLCLLLLTAMAGRAAGGSVCLPEVQADDTGYVLTVSVTPAGAASLNRSSGETFAEGQSVLMSCQANEEFVFDYWMADGIVVSRDSEFRFIMPGHDTSLTAVLHYAPESPANPETSTPKYTLTLATQPVNAASLNRSSGEQFAEDVMVYMSCNVLTDFVFSHWLADGSVVSRDQQFYFKMPAHDVSLTAVCTYSPGSPGNPETGRRQSTVTLSTQPYGAGTFSWANTTLVAEEEQCEIYAYPNGDFTFREWQRDGVTVSSEQVYHFEMPAEDVSLVAIYDYTPANPGNPNPNFFDESTGEVIIDDFTPGSLTEQLFQTTGGITGKVTSLTVAGVASQTDWGVLNNCPACTTLDMSRTSGLSYVPSYNFNGNRVLTNILLPSGIQSIGEYAFGGCPALTTLTILSSTPPVLGTGAFDGTGLQTVYVPALSVALYQQADGWKDFNIQPLANEVSALTVNLPYGTDLAIYKDMYIELINAQSGQKQRYVVTDRLSYTFSSLIHHSVFNVYLRNSKEDVLAEIDGIEIEENDISVTFTTLKVPRTLTLSVLTPTGEDVTSQTTITWTDGKGNFLTRGNSLANMLEGVTVSYSVVLPQALAMQYLLPEVTTYEVTAANDIHMTLTAIPEATISGSVYDLRTGQPIEGAVVTASQMLNGLYSKTFATKTDSQGHWSIGVFEAQIEISASMTNYVSQTITLESIDGQNEIPAIGLKEISGTNILLSFTYTNSNGETQDGLPDRANTTLSVYNETTQQPVDSISVQGSRIVLMEQLPAGTLLRVTATSKNQKFLPAEASAAVDGLDRAMISLDIKQFGGISATFLQTESTDVVGILYDEEGLLLKKYSYTGNALTIKDLYDGEYILVTMAGSQLFNGIGSIGQFAEAGLAEGIDYVMNSLSVRSGSMTSVENENIPALDERKLYYTDAATTFTTNKPQATAGQFVTLTAHIDFKPQYANSVDNVELLVSLPNRCDMVEGSVMVGKSIASYTTEEGRIVVQLPDYGQAVKLCIIPTGDGTVEPTASIRFTLNGKEIVQPIGSAICNVKGLTISMPVATATPEFVVSGTATAGAEVSIYADDMPAGRTTAKQSGKWSCSCTLTDADDNSSHEVYAKVTTRQGAELLSETKSITYYENIIMPSVVSMSFYNAEYQKTIEVAYDLLEKTCTPASYMFCAATDFTFITDFTENNPERITDVSLIVFLNDGTTESLEATYNEMLGKWIAQGRYDLSALPTTVKVKWTDAESNLPTASSSDDNDDEGNAHATPIIDPSGYVYEGVPGNRLQGVTATAYYKETVEDMYGDLHENIVLWNAEDYAQQNPLFTDEYGMYQWDVPQGLWQVKFEKEGYQTAYSEWLPVPPPQLDVNIAMTQLLQPSVKSASAYEDGVEMEFDKYMLGSLLTTQNIIVMADGVPVEGRIEMLNEELADETGSNISGNEAETMASKVRFCAEQPFDTQEITLMVNSRVESYAGIRMQDDYRQTFAIEQEVRQIECEQMVYLTHGTDTTVMVKVLPETAAAGRHITVKSSSATILALTTESISVNDDGTAQVSFRGLMPGTAALTFTVEGTGITATMLVSVSTKEVRVCSKPLPSIASGTMVESGEMLTLSCNTDGATIYYTLDGSDPTDESSSRTAYDGTPIIIDKPMTITAVAMVSGMANSEVVTFTYTVLETVGVSTVDSVASKTPQWHSISGQLVVAPRRGVYINSNRKILVK